MPRPRTILVCGPAGVGKTALIQRFTRNAWAGDVEPTVGLDEHAGEAAFSATDEGLEEELQALLPADGMRLTIWEIGGTRGGHLRQAPRGQQIDGLLLCYSLLHRDSFLNAAHKLMQYRTDRHLDLNAPSVVAGHGRPPAARLPAVLCGTFLDEVDAGGRRTVSDEEVHAFARENGIKYVVTASARTGEYVREAFQALAAAILEAEEDAEAERLVADGVGLPDDAWALPLAGADGAADGEDRSFTSPRGLRGAEPRRGAGDETRQLVEVLVGDGVPLAAPRTLGACLERGLLHRAVHIWICDFRTGGLVLRKYGRTSAKLQDRWGPTCQGEVLCYGSTADPATGPHTSELSNAAAERSLREQLSLDVRSTDLEHWFSSRSLDGKCCELIDIFVVALRDGFMSPSIRLPDGEQVQWVHYTDVFHESSCKLPNLFHIEPPYREAMVRMMVSRIAHSANDRPVALEDLPHGRSLCPLPMG